MCIHTARASDQRTRILVVSGLLVPVSAAAAFVAEGGGWWEIHLVCDFSFALYVTLLLEAKYRRQERLRKVRPLATRGSRLGGFPATDGYRAERLVLRVSLPKWTSPQSLTSYVARFDSKNTAREIGLASSRSAIRACGNAIRALHRYEWDKAQRSSSVRQSLISARRAPRWPITRTSSTPASYHDAEKELVEARVTHALVTDAAFPSMDDLGASPQAYAKGMAEAIGELRRHILDLMRRNELKRCEELLGKMDEMYYVLVSMDYPDGITFGLRRLTDVARSIIERTRGDYTTSSIQASLRETLEAHSANLEGR